MKTIFVYGTLKKGYRNYGYYLDSSNVKPHRKRNNTYELHGYKMYTNGYYPCVVRSDNYKDVITGEIYHVDDDTYGAITNMELNVGYHVTKDQILDVNEDIDFELYAMDPEQVEKSHWHLVEGGTF